MTSASRVPVRDVPLLPGARRLLGHGLEFGRDPLALLQRAREHGDVVRLRFGPYQIYVLNSPDAIRGALVGEARKLEKGLSFGRAKRLIGNGLVLSEGEDHRRQRRLMQPAFHRAEIARYMATMAGRRGAPHRRLARRRHARVRPGDALHYADRADPHAAVQRRRRRDGQRDRAAAARPAHRVAAEGASSRTSRGCPGCLPGPTGASPPPDGSSASCWPASSTVTARRAPTTGT